MAADSIRASSRNFLAGRIEWVTFRALTLKPEGATVLAEASGRGRINTLGEVQSLGVLFGTQRGEHSLGREGRLVQADSDGVVYGIGNRRDGCSEGSLATLLRAEGAF